MQHNTEYIRHHYGKNPMMQLRLSASLFGNAGVMLLVSVASLYVK